MAGEQNKTMATEADPAAFVAGLDHPTRRADAEAMLAFFDRVTGGMPARMWGPSIIGFGRYHYKYDSGREGDFLATGFSPRKANLAFYIMPGYEDLEEPLSRLGKHKMGKSCLYVNKLADVDLAVLEEIVRHGLSVLRQRYDIYPE